MGINTCTRPDHLLYKYHQYLLATIDRRRSLFPSLSKVRHTIMVGLAITNPCFLQMAELYIALEDRTEYNLAVSCMPVF